MKKRLFFAFFTIAFIFINTQNSSAYMVKYKEDYYRLFHVHYQQYPDDVMENIYWLEQSVKADFCNPLYAPCTIENEKDWEKYRYLFMMHINLKLIEQHLRLGRTYDKKTAHFYDAPWKDLYLENLNKTLACYKAGLYYWQEAQLWAEKANVTEFQFRILTDVQYWEDERERIATKDLDYKKILNREISRVEDVIAKFQKMDKDSY